jgi:hypothetical protein
VARTLVSAARVALAVLLGGIALASIAIPSWLTFEYRAGENALRKLGASFSEAKSGGLLVELPTQISDDTLIKEGPHLERLDVAHLNLPHSKLTSLEPLKGLTNLSSLDLLDAAGITGLEPLKGLTNLSSLDLSYAAAERTDEAQLARSAQRHWHHELGAAERTDGAQLARSARHHRNYELGAAEGADRP